MKLGIVGLPQAGKRTLFRLLVGGEANPEPGALGLSKVRDERFDRLVEMHHPRKETPAQIQFSLLPDLDRQADRNVLMFRELEHVDAICHVVRDFRDDAVFHIDGEVDPRRDVLALHEELQLVDMLFIEKRLDRLARERGKKEDAQRAAQETDLLTRAKTHLEAGGPLRTFPFGETDLRLVASYPLLTRKPVIQILNVDEDDLRNPGLIDRMAEGFRDHAFEWIAVSAKIEQEISHLDADDRQHFLEAHHIDQPSLDRLTLLCYRTLGLMSFFTVGPDEVRAWTIRNGSLAPQAARVIHADLERGFIRAEVMRYPDLMSMGSESKLRETGKLLQKGKDYIVVDGDIMNILFKV